MNTINLLAALALVGGLWVAIVRWLAASVRHADPVQDAPVRLALKSARWRPQPGNRFLPTLPTSPGPDNVTTSVGFASAKDLLA